MASKTVHPVLGEIEQIQKIEMPTLSSLTIEFVEASVMVLLLYVILYKFSNIIFRVTDKKAKKAHGLKPANRPVYQAGK